MWRNGFLNISHWMCRNYRNSTHAQSTWSSFTVGGNGLLVEIMCSPHTAPVWPRNSLIYACAESGDVISLWSMHAQRVSDVIPTVVMSVGCAIEAGVAIEARFHVGVATGLWRHVGVAIAGHVVTRSRDQVTWHDVMLVVQSRGYNLSCLETLWHQW